ncbi:hypothetical protein [Taibaiella koreensis]|uniref:hypothetical protein n=1 Tax=Taibaiella koreensis TaxID=1268548 RepID=UPI000E59C700|nr:hypothetical protein [Taibaiella koreensis]
MKKVIIFIGFLTLLGCFIFVGMIYQNNKVAEEFDLFYASSLSGRIVKTDKYSRGANFVLDNNPKQLTFYPYIDKTSNNNNVFQYLAKPGDSIYKPAYSDRLLLIKSNKVYAYTFQKIKN